MVQIQSTCRRQHKCDWNIEICFWTDRGKKEKEKNDKRRKCWLPAFSPFQKMFSKAFFFKVKILRDLKNMDTCT